MALVKASISLILALFVQFGWAAQTCGPEENEADVVRKENDRYEDFFARRKALEKYDERREAAAGEVNGHRQDRYKRLEEAREEYVKNRVKLVEDPALEQHWLEQQRQRNEELDRARTCFVEKKAAAERLHKRGRAIPELEEYDLQDY